MATGLDLAAIRAQFPTLERRVYDDKRLIFLDSAASSQKPLAVTDAMDQFMKTSYANVHRGVHRLSQEATDAFEAARTKVARFMGAEEREVVFTKNATEAINLVAQSWGRKNLRPGDEILLTVLEHHANIVPWQLIAEETGAVVRPVDIREDGSLDMDDFADKLGDRTRMVACAFVSNVLGTVLPVEEIIARAHAQGALVLLDASQAVTHRRVDVRALDVDFLAWTGHKLYGPTGIGVLYGKYDLLDAMPPYQGGGDMIDTVSFAGTTFREPPFRFEAGTPAIVEAVGLGAAVDWVEGVGIEAIAAHEADLLDYAMERMGAANDVRVLGTAPEKVSVLAFQLGDHHANDVGTILDRTGVALRVGQHCAEPLHDRLGVHSTARVSFAAYNGRDDVDALLDGLAVCRELLG
ncbi:MAG: cysteine desulfurase [Alphaproteobacteria bacterium]|nr:cysteine desulfurase [Alphaproteobacteria bacterium]